MIPNTVTTDSQVGHISSLPGEVAEVVIISLAGCPSSIAALSQTCKSFHGLICSPPDDHLWRELTLTLFDDPRDSLPLRLSPASEDVSRYQWRTAYQQRARMISRLEGIDQCSDSGAPSPTYDTRLDLFPAILFMIKTASPVKLDDMLGASPASHFFQRNQQHHPLVVAYQETPELPLPDSLSHITRSVNIQRLSQLPPEGILSLLERREWLMEGFHTGTLTDPTARKACEYIAVCGWPEPSGKTESGLNDENKARSQTYKAAHKKVFDMDYPTSVRSYGPFIPDAGLSHVKVTPDWVHLAAVRLVTQEAIKKKLNIEQHSLFHGLDSIRGGAWATMPQDRIKVQKSLSKAPLDGYDWAGVEGVWR